jgi:hypothetical protein
MRVHIVMSHTLTQINLAIINTFSVEIEEIVQREYPPLDRDYIQLI